ncbi:Txe/YoeB family addiction module toxin [Flammeovirga yaeyamensis]|uniref:Putative mRNA interferase YoeB n=1 Tax=Flammeovirga yaeyamensis TaxID=367791 RepID=A0AAX1MXX3_9BACT|nr:Txe/YoeB family addiction module toxin [Flammeovirga yaeyamensis]MBB3696315.1 toxin YoeB [Flammeovirga yaeyamensis]NMF34994.1 Txe/YoeB family addiction module toxin [Flammeovirga yaeyamensis]QWG00179.1 Txe/YoeB family addiction module toxin [Flammeovirga yaeyamensis]
MNILFSKTAWQQYLFWQTEDKKITLRIHELIKNIQRDPFKGIGKPEPLRQNLTGFWSRRINSEHRLIYRIVGKKNEGQRIEIISCQYHY